VRILLDESLPKPLARLLVGHEVRTVVQMRWSSLANGALLRQALASGFDVLLTADQNLPFQQNLNDLPIPSSSSSPWPTASSFSSRSSLR
jgi:hypothetical protein